MARKSQDHSDQMLVWAIGLMGAGLFALPAFLASTCNGPIEPNRVILAAAPWVLGVVLALLSRIFGSLRRDAEDLLLIAKFAALDTLHLELLERSAGSQPVSLQLLADDRDSLLKIMRDERPNMSKFARRERCLHPVAEGAYYAGLIAFGVGIVFVFWMIRLCHLLAISL
jgi:hypothetical protein